jgi:hypothetical protein
LAASSVSSTATRAPGPSAEFTKSMVMASSAGRGAGGRRHHRSGQVEPPSPPLPAPSTDGLDDRGAHAGFRRGDYAARCAKENAAAVAPARCGTSVGRSRKSRAPRRRTMKLCVAVLLELGLVLVDLLRGRRRSSLPKRPSSGQEGSDKLIGGFGCFGVSSSLLITTRPPHSSPRRRCSWYGKRRKVCRPPEGAEYPDLAVEPGLGAPWTAPSVSPMT